MYRWNSIEEYEKRFDEAYVKGLENGVYDDFTATALAAMRADIACLQGGFKGITDAIENVGIEDSQEKDYICKRMEEIKEWLELYIEASTKKLEELGLL